VGNQTRMQLDRKIANAVYRRSFPAFVYAGYRALYPGNPLIATWHIDYVCSQIEQLLGNPGVKRLVINLPPRKLKSFIVSVFLPAWLLGQNPSTRIICASYSEDLAFKFSRDCRALLETTFYKRLFRGTRLSRTKASESEFLTT